MKDQEQNKRLTIEQGRSLLQHTSLKNLSDEELDEFLDAIQAFCEINFEIYNDVERYNKLQASLKSDNEILLHSDRSEPLDNAA